MLMFDMNHSILRNVPACPGTGRSFRRRAVLSIFTLSAIILAGVSWWNDMAGFSFPNVGLARSALADEAQDPRVNKRFVLGGLKLGMTFAMVKAVYPAAKINRERGGRRIIALVTGRGLMVAWMKAQTEPGSFQNRKVERIYRLQLNQTFTVMTEQEIIYRYAREYGRPLETACVRAAQSPSPRCTYRWWGGGGIALQAISKKETDAQGRTYTQLTTIAFDTAAGPAART